MRAGRKLEVLPGDPREMARSAEEGRHDKGERRRGKKVTERKGPAGEELPRRCGWARGFREEEQ